MKDLIEFIKKTGQPLMYSEESDLVFKETIHENNQTIYRYIGKDRIVDMNKNNLYKV